MLDWIDLIPESPFSRPCWRWDLGRWILRHGDEVPGKYRDAGVERVVRFLTARRVRRSVMGAAKELFEVKTSVRTSLLEAHILSGAAMEVVAERTANASEVVAAYTSVFFDVGGRLIHRDWIARHAIGTGMWSGFKQNEIGVVWKMFGYYGGIDMLDAVLTVCVADGLVKPADIPRQSDTPRIGDRLRESIRTAIMVSMLPPNTSFEHYSELHLHCRRQQSRQQPRNIAARAATIVQESLAQQTFDDALTLTQCYGTDARKMVGS